MKATYIFVVLAMALSSLAATTPVQNNRVSNNCNRSGGQGSSEGQNGQQNKGAKNNTNNQTGKNANNSNSKNKNTGSGAAGAAGGTANTGSVRTSNNGSNKNQNQGSNSTASNSTASNSTASNSTASNSTASNSTASAGSGSNSADAQTSSALDPAVIAKGFANNGQGTPTAGQVASLTSTNNFINFCLTVPKLPLTNGQQITTGSCNPAPMGILPSNANMPSAKFVFPANGATIKENTEFTIQMAIQNMETGNFVNAEENYFAAPQQLNGQGQIIGHSHVVVETLSALDQTTPTNPLKFAFFKGLNAAAVKGVLTADVTAGLPAGFYKLSSINTAANHQPVLVPVAQHGSLDDAVYFTVNANGQGASNSTAAAGAAGAAGAAAGAANTGAGAAGAAAGAAGGAAAGAGAANTGKNGANKGAKGTNTGNKAQGNQNQNQGGNKANTSSQQTANQSGNQNQGGQKGRSRRSMRLQY
jgi:hypothetical protein